MHDQRILFGIRIYQPVEYTQQQHSSLLAMNKSQLEANANWSVEKSLLQRRRHMGSSEFLVKFRFWCIFGNVRLLGNSFQQKVWACHLGCQ